MLLPQGGSLGRSNKRSTHFSIVAVLLRTGRLDARLAVGLQQLVGGRLNAPVVVGLQQLVAVLLEPRRLNAPVMAGLEPRVAVLLEPTRLNGRHRLWQT